jgi:hypothetical protein
MAKHWLGVGVLLLGSICSYAQDASVSKDEFKPSGKMDGRIFANYHSTVDGDKRKSGFEVKRAYMGYTYQMDPMWTARVLLDVDEKNPSAQYAFFRNAVLYYTNNNLKVGFGIQDTYNMKVQEKIWGKRYVEKSYIDFFGLGNSADIGLTAMYQSGIFALDGGVFNGEGYKSTQKDNTFRVNVGVTGYFFDGQLVVRVADEYEERVLSQNLTTLFVGYAGKKVSGGLEYNYQTNHKHIKDNHRGGISAFASVGIHSKMSLFGRFEQMATNGATVLANDGSYYIGGLEYRLNKNIKSAINLQGNDLEASADTNMFAFLNIEVTF